MADNMYETPVPRTFIELENKGEAGESSTDLVAKKTVGISRIPEQRQLVPANFYDNLPKRQQGPRVNLHETTSDKTLNPPKKKTQTLQPTPNCAEGETYVEMSGGVQIVNATTADDASVDVRGTMYDTLPEKPHALVYSENDPKSTPKLERPKRPNMRLPNVPNIEQNSSHDLAKGETTPHSSMTLQRDKEQGVKTPHSSMTLQRDKEQGVKTPHASMTLKRDKEQGEKKPHNSMANQRGKEQDHASMEMHRDEEQGVNTPQVSLKTHRDKDDRCQDKDTVITVPVLRRMLSLCVCVFVIGLVVGVGLTLVVMLTKFHLTDETVVVVTENSKISESTGSTHGSATTNSPGLSNTLSSGSISTVNPTSSSTASQPSNVTTTQTSSSTASPPSNFNTTQTSSSTSGQTSDGIWYTPET